MLIKYQIGITGNVEMSTSANGATADGQEKSEEKLLAVSVGTSHTDKLNIEGGNSSGTPKTAGKGGAEGDKPGTGGGPGTGLSISFTITCPCTKLEPEAAES